MRLPGLVDMHVHLRDPGQTHKEDFYSGTSAALAGGFTRVFDMPNNAVPVTTLAILDDKVASAQEQIVSDVGFYFTSNGENLREFPRIVQRVRGLKLYLNGTTGKEKVDMATLLKIFKAWASPKPILLHAGGHVIGRALELAQTTGQNVHICHVAGRAELESIVAAKRSGIKVTCGVTPHHLFLNEHDAKRLGTYGRVHPELQSQSDQDYLWEHLGDIDAVESDHAPHTRAEKEAGALGFPGLETTLPLLLEAEREGRLSRDDVLGLLVYGPMSILGLEPERDTFIEVDPVEYEISDRRLKTKAAWTPYNEMIGFGRVKRVTLRGIVAYEDGAVLADPGSGRLL